MKKKSINLHYSLNTNLINKIICSSFDIPDGASNLLYAFYINNFHSLWSLYCKVRRVVWKNTIKWDKDGVVYVPLIAHYSSPFYIFFNECGNRLHTTQPHNPHHRQCSLSPHCLLLVFIGLECSLWVFIVSVHWFGVFLYNRLEMVNGVRCPLPDGKACGYHGEHS